MSRGEGKRGRYCTRASKRVGGGKEVDVKSQIKNSDLNIREEGFLIRGRKLQYYRRRF